MSRKKYKLTISILASNRKDTLPKTLESIKPILNNISSELIVTDTGCDEELLSVIRRYTDKIVKFEWCKDFAKARNVGLKMAQGEWFMFIDDDEWVEDVSEFISFFNSEEMNQYSYGRYIVRNYRNMEGTDWTDSVAGRMFRILEGTIFVDAIHEWADNVAGPIRNFASYAHHYGYVYKSDEERMAHIRRNLDLLRDQLEKDKKHARHYIHTAQEYCIIKEYDEVISLCQDGIVNADMTIKANHKDIPALYAMTIWALVKGDRYKEAYEKGMEYMASVYCNELCAYAMSEFISVALYMDGQYEKSLEYASKYFEYKEYFKSHQEVIFQQGMALLVDADSAESMERVAVVGMIASSFMKDMKLLESYMNRLDFSKVILMPDMEKFTMNIVAMLIDDIRLAKGASIVTELLKDDRLAMILFREIFAMKEENPDGYYKLADIVNLTESERGHVWYLRILSARDNIYTDELNHLYRRLLESDANIMTLDNDLWDIALQKGIDMGGLVGGISMRKWMAMVDRFMSDAKIRAIIEKKQYMDKLIPVNTSHMIYMNMVVSEAFLVRMKLEDVTADRLKCELMEYAENALNFYREIYTDEAMFNHPSITVPRCQAAVAIWKLCKGLFDVSKAKKQIVEFMPRFRGIMEKYEEIA